MYIATVLNISIIGLLGLRESEAAKELVHLEHWVCENANWWLSKTENVNCANEFVLCSLKDSDFGDRFRESIFVVIPNN